MVSVDVDVWHRALLTRWTGVRLWRHRIRWSSPSRTGAPLFSSRKWRKSLS